MSKARLLADLMRDSQITASEITGLELNAIQEGDTVVEVVDDGAGGKVTVKVDNVAGVLEIDGQAITVPRGTTAERSSNPSVGELRYNTTTGFFESYALAGWGSIASPPVITGVSPTSFDGTSGSTFTVNGSNFDSGSTAAMVGADGTTYSAGSTTVVNNGQITFTTGQNLPVSNEPYKVKITSGAQLSALSVATIDAGSSPTFTTAAGSIATTTAWNEAVNTSVSATDPEGQTVTYSIVAGSLPSGVTLDANTGAITGTSTQQGTTTYTFTVQAADASGNTNTREFSITITNDGPEFVTATQTFTFDQGAAGSYTLNASDTEGDTITFSLVSGTLPTGITLSSDGVLSGTFSGSSSVSNTITVEASDGSLTVQRDFTVAGTVPQPFIIYGDTNTTPTDITETRSAPAGTVYYAIMGGGGSGAATHYQGGGSGYTQYGSFTHSGGGLQIVVGGRSGREENLGNSNRAGIDGRRSAIETTTSTVIVQALGGGRGGGSQADGSGYSGGGGAGNSGYGGNGGANGNDGQAGATVVGGLGQGTSHSSAFINHLANGLGSIGFSGVSVNAGGAGSASGGSHAGGGGGGGIDINYSGSPNNPNGLDSQPYHSAGGGTGGSGWGSGGGASGYDGGNRGKSGNGAPGFVAVWW